MHQAHQAHQAHTAAIVCLETHLNAHVYARFDLMSAAIALIEAATKYRYVEVQRALPHHTPPHLTTPYHRQLTTGPLT